jgi:PleD family two-component response regulator
MARKKAPAIEQKELEPEPTNLKKILIVEDQQSVLDAYQITMKSNGFKIFAAHDFQEAIDTYRDNAPFDICLLDMFLPNCKGYELIDHLKTQFNMSEPFIFISGEPSLDTVLDAIKSGPSEYIMKPISNRELMQRINKVLEKKEQQDTRLSIVGSTIEQVILLNDKYEKDLGDYIEYFTTKLSNPSVKDDLQFHENLTQSIELLKIFHSCLQKIK